MKKSLIALAALGAFAGAASAQSSVTLYGQIDLSYQYVKGGDLSPIGDNDLNRLGDGHIYGPGSRWGLRVSEDLGSGLKANVVLESGFTADNGVSAQGGRLFGRQAFVSLASANLGEVRLGRQYSLHDETIAINNPFGNSTVLNPGAGNTLAAGSLPLFVDAVRIDNAVQYITPSFGGFRVQAMVAAGEGAADRYQGIKASYANGPLVAALAYEQSKGVGAGRPDVNELITVGANYNFGVAKVFAGYQQGKDLAFGAAAVGSQITLAAAGLPGIGIPTESQSYTVGASVPFGAFTVGANFTSGTWENAAGADVDLQRAGVVGQYSLSKLTTVYAGYSQALGDLKDRVTEKHVFQLGLRKAF